MCDGHGPSYDCAMTRKTRRLLVGLAAGLVSIAAVRGGGEQMLEDLPPAQARMRATIWGNFFDACLREAPGGEYGCACAASYSMGLCRAQNTPREIDQCMTGIARQPSYGNDIRSRCGAYGRMSTRGVPGAATARMPAQPHQIPAWTGGFNGCLQNATPEERRRSHNLEYTCACVTTFLINQCIAAPGSTREGYPSCVARHNAQIQNAGRVCLQYGHLTVR